MRKDIDFPVGSKISIGLVPDKREGNIVYEVVFINENDFAIDSVIVNSEGHGVSKGENVKTANVRYLLHTVDSHSYRPFEFIVPETAKLTHRFWISYFYDGKLFDKKIILEPGMLSIRKELPVVGKKGIVVY